MYIQVFLCLHCTLCTRNVKFSLLKLCLLTQTCTCTKVSVLYYTCWLYCTVIVFQGTGIHLEITDCELCWQNVKTNSLIANQPINRMRVWAVGQEDERYFNFLSIFNFNLFLIFYFIFILQRIWLYSQKSINKEIRLSCF